MYTPERRDPHIKALDRCESWPEFNSITGKKVKEDTPAERRARKRAEHRLHVPEDVRRVRPPISVQAIKKATTLEQLRAVRFGHVWKSFPPDIRKAGQAQEAKIRYHTDEVHRTRLIARKQLRHSRMKPVYPNEEYGLLSIYENSNKEVHVDHIVPLKHRDVCGLHCVANLQLLPATENFSKKNTFDPSVYPEQGKTAGEWWHSPCNP
jgi:hypothetical protein